MEQYHVHGIKIEYISVKVLANSHEEALIKSERGEYDSIVVHDKETTFERVFHDDES